MDACFLDVTIEFIAVAFHSILYYTAVYPSNIFETRRKYNVVVYSCVHPEVNQYIDLCLKTAKECLKSNQLERVVFAVTNKAYEPKIKFVFDISKQESYDETNDAYLIQTEQNLRAFCLSLSSNTDKFKGLPEDSSFTVYIHTNESTAVSLATSPELEDFPFVEVSEKCNESDSIIPLKSIPIRGFRLETYMELDF